MAIQQVANGSSNGIMSFLFQDDGSTEGTVLEGEQFALTLHQLLGEYDDAAAQAGTPADVTTARAGQHAEPKELAAPLSLELETLVKDFDLPEHGADLPAEDQEIEQPFWGIAPFTDVMAALREHTTALHDGTAELDAAAAANDAATAVPADTTASAFGSGIAHVIELARDAAQVSTQLAGHPAPMQPRAGRNAPAGGNSLPPGFRSAAVLNQAAAAHASRNAQAAHVTTDSILPLQASDATVSTTFFSDLLDAKTPERQSSAPQNQNPAQGIQALRSDSLVAIPPRTTTNDTTATSNAFPLHSPHLAGTEAWFEDLGARVDWLKDMNVEKAELQLHPAELGLLEIHISTGDDATTVSFVTHNAEARELIEDSMPRLRELLASQGMQLGESQVSQHSDGQRRHQDMNTGPAARRDDAPEEAAPVRRRAYVADPNRIDHYV